LLLEALEVFDVLGLDVTVLEEPPLPFPLPELLFLERRPSAMSGCASHRERPLS
jgi:hypothetical protein